MADELKKDVMQLVYIGHIEAEVDVLGYKFTMHTLNSSEDIEVLSNISHLEGPSQIAQMQIEMLARAIKTVNGIALEDLYVEQNKEKPVTDKIRKRVAYVSSWQIGLVSKLFTEYNTLVERSNKALGL